MRIKDFFPNMAGWRDSEIAGMLLFFGVVGFALGFFTVYLPFNLRARLIDAKPITRLAIPTASIVVPVILVVIWIVMCSAYMETLAGTVITASLFGYIVGLIFGGAVEWARPH